MFATNEGDAAVSQSNPTTNYGTGTYMALDPRVISLNRPYLRINLTNVTLPSVEVATLRIGAYIVEGGAVSRNISAYYCPDHPFNETQITWNNQPLDGSCSVVADYNVSNAVAGGSPETWHEWNFTDSVNAELAAGVDGDNQIIFTIVIVYKEEEVAASDRDVLYYSRNRSVKSQTPQFVLQYLPEMPDVTLDGPKNNSILYLSDWPIIFNFSSESSYAIKNVSLWGNWSGVWKQNQTNTTLVPNNNSTYDFFGINISKNTYYIWNVQVCNVNENCSFADANWSFSVSNSVPIAPTISYPVNGNNYSSIPYINYSSEDADSDAITYNIFINNSLNITTTINLSVWNASDGYYNLTVQATDGENYSINSTPVLFHLDTTAPTFSGNEDNSTAIYPRRDDTIQVNITINDSLVGVNGYFVAHNDSGTMTNSSFFTVASNIFKILYNITITTMKKGDTLGWQVWVNDTLNNIRQSDIFTIIIRNSAPTLKTDLIFLNWSAGHKFNVTATFSDNDEATDFGNHTIEHTTGSCEYHSNTTAGDDMTVKYICEGTAYDTLDIRMNASDLSSIQINSSLLGTAFPNQVPTMIGAELNKTSGVLETDDLNCTSWGADDLDSDLTGYFFEWYKDSIAQGINVSNLTSHHTSAGEDWYCESWIGDQYDNSTKYTSTTVTIGAANVAPTIDAMSIMTQPENVNSSSIYPTNNNTYLNLTINFTDADTENWTAYFCNTPNFNDCRLNASGQIYCMSAVNLTDKSLGCKLNVSTLTSSKYNVYGFIQDNLTLSSTAKAGTFHINHYPTDAVLQEPVNRTNRTVNHIFINYTATDVDNDIINITIFNSTDGITWSILNTTFTGHNWTDLNDGTYYIKAYSIDEHNYSNYVNTSFTIFDIDTTPPYFTLNRSNSTFVRYGDILQLNITITDASRQIDGYRFSHNATGSIVNGSFVSVDDTTINLIYNISISNLRYKDVFGWQLWANDTLGNTNQSDIFLIEIRNTPPTTPIVSYPLNNGKYSSIDINYTSIDYDNETITYDVYINDSINFTGNTNITWWNASDGTYSLKVSANDSINTSSNSSALIFTFDTTSPSINKLYVSSTSVTTDGTVTFYGNATDADTLTIASCKYTLLKSDYNGGNGVGNRWNESTTTKSGDILSFSLAMTALGSGNLQWKEAHCEDTTGNKAANMSVGINITISTPSAGPGGGGGPPLPDIVTEVEKQLNVSIICGNGICQEGENPLTCSQDCPLNVDELFCWVGDKECAAWVFNFLFYGVIFFMLYVTYRKQTKKKTIVAVRRRRRWG